MKCFLIKSKMQYFNLPSPHVHPIISYQKQISTLPPPQLEYMIGEFS